MRDEWPHALFLCLYSINEKQRGMRRKETSEGNRKARASLALSCFSSLCSFFHSPLSPGNHTAAVGIQFMSHSCYSRVVMVGRWWVFWGVFLLIGSFHAFTSFHCKRTINKTTSPVNNQQQRTQTVVLGLDVRKGSVRVLFVFISLQLNSRFHSARSSLTFHCNLVELKEHKETHFPSSVTKVKVYEEETVDERMKRGRCVFLSFLFISFVLLSVPLQWNEQEVKGAHGRKQQHLY